LPHIRKDTRKEESKEKVRAAGPLDKKSPIQAVPRSPEHAAVFTSVKDKPPAALKKRRP